ncbi:MAG: hypothetical protein M3Q98_14980 [Actinomycetota bacterium]|nr:hypothetical protein [Actinomycetota bacterium]
MEGRARDNTFFAKHRPVVILILVLLGLYAVTGAIHYLRSYDYTGDAVAAYESAQENGEDVGILTQSRSEGLVDSGTAIHSTVERLAKPGNARFASVFERIVAETEVEDDASAKGECFLFPVVPQKGDSIDEIVGFTRFCFEDPRDNEKYTAISVAISNR